MLLIILIFNFIYLFIFFCGTDRSPSRSLSRSRDEKHRIHDVGFVVPRTCCMLQPERTCSNSEPRSVLNSKFIHSHSVFVLHSHCADVVRLLLVFVCDSCSRLFRARLQAGRVTRNFVDSSVPCLVNNSKRICE